MKNTKSLFSTGIALAIALFVSIDIVAMTKKEMTKEEMRIDELEERVKAIENVIINMGPKEKKLLIDSWKSNKTTSWLAGFFQ